MIVPNSNLDDFLSSFSFWERRRIALYLHSSVMLERYQLANEEIKRKIGNTFFCIPEKNFRSLAMAKRISYDCTCDEFSVIADAVCARIYWSFQNADFEENALVLDFQDERIWDCMKNRPELVDKITKKIYSERA